ncbi:SPASM domain peptide maturase of grasp-with-spasm system [Chitinophaga polysaccharea]|uniref:SPASM domain peptide maturase of grasp-with-spasm system n=1 Tax=Chitinophaga polysaccharea TaxID=1293035 RepID=A0A561PP73_9BACT|nr:grasp-with-spasm system SPASM domain peptide maturase [Chitinophaga polysaccharea]TWF39911.1 SPASM domain peptide maturase of grasp-with-spasm system [Chitinophaga polysaccharea]
MEYLNLYANCQLVKGANMSLLCDLQLRKFYHLPNDTAEVLTFLQQGSIDECIAHYGEDNREAITGYIDYVISKELGFIDNRLLTELIPLDLSWDRYSDITNVIIEYNNGIDYTGNFFRELFDLHIQGLEIRYYQPATLDNIRALLEVFNGTTLKYIKLVLPYDEAVTLPVWDRLVKQYPRVKSLLLHTAPVNKVEKVFDGSVSVACFSSSINSCLACGEIRTGYFTANMELFTESQHHNTCLNRKLSVDQHGYIRNCPSMRENFGHVGDTSLQEVLDNPAFHQYANIRKDEIAVCKDCEFRHVCTDCRAYIENPQDRYSKPLKCGYNPYTNTWDDWTEHPLKQTAIAAYGLEEIIK